MSQALAYIISGLVAGALYAVMASGLVLTYASARIFNFAQGAFGFVAAVVYYELHTGLGWPVVPSAVVSIGIVAPGLGYLLHRLMFNRLTTAPETAQIVATIGLLVGLPALALGIVELLRSKLGADLPSIVNSVAPPGLGPSPKHFWNPFGDVLIDSDQLVTFIAAAVCALALWLLLTRTRLGLAMRATADHRELADMRGLSPDRASAAAWTLGSGLAGLVGVLAAPIYGLNANGFTLLLFMSATAAVFGRMASIPVTFIAGLLLGVVQNLVAGYADFAKSLPGFRNAVPVILLFVGLLLLNRQRGRVAGTVADDAPPPDYLAHLPTWRRALPWSVLVLGIVVLSSFVLGRFWTGVIAQGLALSLVFLSITLVTGLGGMVSFAQATFVTMAGLTTGFLYQKGGLPLGVAATVGVAAAAAMGLIVALPSLRLGGRVLALATLALALLGDQVLFQLSDFNNRTLGWDLPIVAIGPWELSDPTVMVLFLLVLLGALVLGYRNLERSGTGRAILAVRASPAAAATNGVSSVRTRLLLFTLSAGLAGLGGVVYALYQGRVTATDFPAMTGFAWLAVVVIFGVRRPGAAIVAGLVTALMPQLLVEYVTDSPFLPTILFGLGGMGLAQQPDGLLAQIAEGRHHKRRARAAAAEAKRVTTTAVDIRTPESHRTAASLPGTSSGTQPSARDAVLSLSSVDAGYGDVLALRGVDLTVPRGSVVALLGANGAGKSTLCKLASGLVVPRAGRLTFEGRAVTGWTASEAARAGVFTAPEARGVFPGLTVEENLASWLPSRAEREQVLDRFPGLARRRGVPAGVLSGGEQQLLALSPMLVRPPVLAVADEPSLGLAPRIVDEVFTVFAELRAKGVSLLLAEEKSTGILDVADFVVFLRVGRVVWSGPRADVDPAALAEAYLGLAHAVDPEQVMQA